MRNGTGPPRDATQAFGQEDAIAKEPLDDWLDQALEATFPASDPVASPPASPEPAESPGEDDT